MKRRWLLPALSMLLILPRFAEAQLFQDNTGRGAALGTVAGALAGAGIGKHNGNTAAGALIGGAAGLITGAAIGSSADQQERRQAQVYQQQQAWQRAQAATVEDVIAMSRSGVSDDVIITHVRQYGLDRRLEVSDVIRLHQQGVSEAVIAAMQRGTTAVRVKTVPPPPVPGPVVVEEYHYVAPPYYYRYGPWGYPHFHHPPPPPRPGLQWGVTFYGH